MNYVILWRQWRFEVRCKISFYTIPHELRNVGWDIATSYHIHIPLYIIWISPFHPLASANSIDCLGVIRMFAWACRFAPFAYLFYFFMPFLFNSFLPCFWVCHRQGSAILDITSGGNMIVSATDCLAN